LPGGSVDQQARPIRSSGEFDAIELNRMKPELYERFDGIFHHVRKDCTLIGLRFARRVNRYF
jgi:hypothetical protein